MPSPPSLFSKLISHNAKDGIGALDELNRREVLVTKATEATGNRRYNKNVKMVGTTPSTFVRISLSIMEALVWCGSYSLAVISQIFYPCASPSQALLLCFGTHPYSLSPPFNPSASFTVPKNISEILIQSL